MSTYRGESLASLLRLDTTISVCRWWDESGEVCLYPTIEVVIAQTRVDLGVDVVAIRSVIDGCAEAKERLFGDPDWLGAQPDLSYAITPIAEGDGYRAERTAGNPMAEIWLIDVACCREWLDGLDEFCRWLAAGDPVYLGGSELRIT